MNAQKAFTAINVILLVLTFLMVASETPAAVYLGDPPSMTEYTGCQSNSTEIEIDPSFQLYIRNCWDEPVRILLTLTYHTPGGDLSDTDQYGAGERMALFPNKDPEEWSSSIENVLGDPDNYQSVVTVRAKTFSLDSGSQLGTAVTAQRAEDPVSVQMLPPGLEAEIREQLRREVLVRSIHPGFRMGRYLTCS